MTSKKNYSRYFIILQEDEKGYAIGPDKQPSGYVKLETKSDKCKISFYAQNLKKQMGPYYLLLICCKKEIKKLIKIGEMNIDDLGRAENYFEYIADDIAQTNISMDKVVGASIVKMVGENISVIMSGFTTTQPPKDWCKYPIIFKELEKPKEIPKVIEKEKCPDKNDMEDKKHKECKQCKECKDEEKHEEKELEKDIEENKDNIFDKYEEEIEKCKEERNDDVDPTEEFFRKLFGDFQELSDTCTEISRSKWYKIPVNDMNDLYNSDDYKKYTVLYYPMISCYPYIKKHGHYIMGCKKDANNKMKYLVYGILGTKSPMDQPYGGRTGFVTWVPKNSNYEEESGLGYWLLFYDIKHSVIVVPMKK